MTEIDRLKAENEMLRDVLRDVRDVLRDVHDDLNTMYPFSHTTESTTFDHFHEAVSRIDDKITDVLYGVVSHV
jgi:hypothetical protein